MTKRRRVVYLSRVDRERLERGEITAPEQALHHETAPDRQTFRVAEHKKERLSARDRELLEDRPPHWG